MQTFFRVTLLSVFAAAGIGLAVAVAVETGSGGAFHLPWTNLLADIAPASTGDSKGGFSPLPEPPPDEPPTDEPPSDEDTQVAAAEPIEIPQTQAAPAPLHDPVASQIERLEATLQKVEAVNEQSRIERLERTIERFQEAAERDQAIIEQQIAAANQPAPLPEPENEGPEAAEPLPLPSDPQIEKNAGDGKLIVNIKDSDIRQVLEYLSQQSETNILASPNVQGKVTASLSGVSVDEAIDAILQLTGFVARREGKFVYIGTPADLSAMDQLRDKISTRVYRPNYVTAADLQLLITPLLTENIGRITVSTPAENGIPSDSVHTGGDSFAHNEVLLVRDYENVLAQIDHHVTDIDKPPRQVVIEAMILSVTLDDSFRMGINLETLRDKSQVRVINNSPLLNLGNIDFSEGGLNIGFLDSSLAAFIEALDSVGDTEVIAAPRLLCLNRQRAEILIGDQKGYLNTTQTETATTQTVEFLDIGTQLRIRPFISSDGTIRMEVHPELSTGDVRLLGQFALPEKSVTQVTTNIMCRDGATVVIGGLIRDDLSKSVSQIPLLGDIPVLGAIARRKTETVTRSEIIVVITPRIIHDPMLADDGRPTAAEIHHRQSKIFTDRMTHVARRYYSSRYIRLARSAWAAGNADQALSYIELALSFTRHRLEALRLRDEILSGGPPIEYIETTSDATEQVAPPDLPIDDESSDPPALQDVSLPAYDDAPRQPPPAVHVGPAIEIGPPPLPGG